MIRVVLSGSFHRDTTGLTAAWRELEATGCRILSPLSINFADHEVAVVKTIYEQGIGVAELERLHLRAIREADFIWLHAPLGYVGVSASFELGFAMALGTPCFCREPLQDTMLQAQVTVVPSVFAARESLKDIPN